MGSAQGTEPFHVEKSAACNRSAICSGSTPHSPKSLSTAAM